MSVSVIGAGLAGCEAAWQIASRGINVTLYEMKPQRFSPAHTNPDFAELVCSNSLRSDSLTNAVGLLKEEMRIAGSLIMRCADATRVPAGGALAVDRARFSRMVTEQIRSHPRITVVERELDALPDPDGINVIATGPLTSDAFSSFIASHFDCPTLHFFDAAAPIISAESIDYSIAYFASRYGKGGPEDYLNCPMTSDEYRAFYDALITAELAPLHSFDTPDAEKELRVFEGCMPVEVMAARGYETLCYGPLKPVGLPDPKTGREPFAVVQLRKEDEQGSMYNLVGFQTHLTFPEQRRVFRMIPGLAEAEFYRYGKMHRNTYLQSPGFLSSDYSVRRAPHLYFAGQMTGVEGYVESAGSGLVAGISAAFRAKGTEPFAFPETTVLGAMGRYVAYGGIGSFQPMNANFGLLPRLGEKVRGGKAARYEKISERSLADLQSIKSLFEEGIEQ